MKYKNVYVNMWTIFKRKMEETVNLLYQYFAMKDRLDIFEKLIIKRNRLIKYTLCSFEWLW